MNSSTIQLLFPLLFIGILYFLMIRPQQKKNKAIQKMRENLKVGDKVVTIGGINGTIIKSSDEILTIEIGADKLKLQLSKWAIGTVEEQ
ncbi:MAG: preprotein translocase subunit YajC [Peptostreptococcaceae bacterium]|nr:preprotein translocase subunit YajC [Peptostreptococcaceae bacterium]